MPSHSEQPSNNQEYEKFFNNLQELHQLTHALIVGVNKDSNLQESKHALIKLSKELNRLLPYNTQADPTAVDSKDKNYPSPARQEQSLSEQDLVGEWTKTAKAVVRQIEYFQKSDLSSQGTNSLERTKSQLISVQELLNVNDEIEDVADKIIREKHNLLFIESIFILSLLMYYSGETVQMVVQTQYELGGLNIWNWMTDVFGVGLATFILGNLPDLARPYLAVAGRLFKSMRENKDFQTDTFDLDNFAMKTTIWGVLFSILSLAVDRYHQNSLDATDVIASNTPLYALTIMFIRRKITALLTNDNNNNDSAGVDNNFNDDFNLSESK